MLVRECFTLRVRVDFREFVRKWSLVKEDGVGFSEDLLDRWYSYFNDGINDDERDELWQVVHIVKPKSCLVGIIRDGDGLEAHVTSLDFQSVRTLELGLIWGLLNELVFYVRESFEKVFEKCGVYNEEGVPTRCFCYCPSCTGEWWSGVTNGLGLVKDEDPFDCLLGVLFIHGCYCEARVELFEGERGRLPLQFCDETWRRLSLGE